MNEEKENIFNKTTEADTLVLLKNELVEVGKHAKENWDLYLRAKADIENLNKLYERNLNVEQRKYVLEFVKDLLSVADSIDFGIKESKNFTDNSCVFFRTGLLSIRELFVDILFKHKITILDPIGCEFDPMFHEVIKLAQINCVDDHNKILEVIQKGYVYSSIILRTAKVIVGIVDNNII